MAPPGPRAQPSPYDATYQGQVNAYGLGYQNTLAENQYQGQQADQTYGYTTDPSGHVRQLGPGDPNYDPFNQAQMLKSAYQQRNTGSTNSYSNQGQLYSGALQHSLDSSLNSYTQADDSNQRGYLGTQHRIQQSDVQAGTTYAQQVAGAAGDAMNRALAATPNDPGPAATPGVRTNNVVGSPRHGQQYTIQKGSNGLYHVYGDGTRIKVKEK